MERDREQREREREREPSRPLARSFAAGVRWILIADCMMAEQGKVIAVLLSAVEGGKLKSVSGILSQRGQSTKQCMCCNPPKSPWLRKIFGKIQKASEYKILSEG